MLFDPEKLENPLALKTGWGPVREGGSSEPVPRLIKKSAKRIELIPDMGVLLRPRLSTLLSFLLISMLAYHGITGENDNLMYVCLPFLFVLFYSFASMLHQSTMAKIFDFNVGYYWHGNNKTSRIDINASKEHCLISSIEAIQIVSECCYRGSGISNADYYSSYELNLVLSDATRINVLDNDDYDIIKMTAQKIARFLNVPLWDALEK